MARILFIAPFIAHIKINLARLYQGRKKLKFLENQSLFSDPLPPPKRALSGFHICQIDYLWPRRPLTKALPHPSPAPFTREKLTPRRWPRLAFAQCLAAASAHGGAQPIGRGVGGARLQGGIDQQRLQIDRLLPKIRLFKTSVHLGRSLGRCPSRNLSV